MNAQTAHARLARIHATVLVIWIVIVILTPYASYARLPPELSVGLGLGRLALDAGWLHALLWSPGALAALKWTAIAGCLIRLVAGPRARWLMPGVCLTVLTLDALTKSLTGYVNHAQLAPLLVLCLVTLFDVVAFDRRHAVWLIRFALVVPYTFLGLHRLMEGGLDVFTGDALPIYIAQNSAGYSLYGFTLGLRLIDVPALAAALKAGFAVMTLLEVLAVGTLFSARFAVVWVSVMVAFHVATLPTLNILFWENALLLVVAFMPGIGQFHAAAPVEPRRSIR